MWTMRLMDFVLSCTWWIGKLAVPFRYRQHVSGLKEIEQMKSDFGTVFLINHPSLLDGPLVSFLLWRKFKPRPVLIDYFFHMKELRFILHFLRSISIPSLDMIANKRKLQGVEKAFEEIAEGLKKKENYIISPAGHLKLRGEEKIGGASLIPKLIKVCPEVNIVFVRITGMWGSSFSRACIGNVPNVNHSIVEGAKAILKSGIFFLPKRDIYFEFCPAPQDFPKAGTKKEINTYLERWFNHYPEEGAEPLKLVSFSLWEKKYPEIIQPKEEKIAVFESDIPEDNKKGNL